MTATVTRAAEPDIIERLIAWVGGGEWRIWSGPGLRASNRVGMRLQKPRSFLQQTAYLRQATFIRTTQVQQTLPRFTFCKHPLCAVAELFSQKSEEKNVRLQVSDHEQVTLSNDADTTTQWQTSGKNGEHVPGQLCYHLPGARVLWLPKRWFGPGARKTGRTQSQRGVWNDPRSA